jgi:hypothetical protein
MPVTISGDSPNLTSAGLASPVFSGTPTGTGVLTSGTAVASTSGTSIDFTSIPSWVKRVTVMFSGVSTNGSSFPYLVQIGPSGGVETTGYLGSSSSLTASAISSATETAGFSLRQENSAATVLHGSMTITNITGNTWVASGVFGQSDRGFTLTTGGSKSLAGTFSRVRITTVGGTDTFDAGSINILYE